jgi:protoporphyrinogen oxidase
MDSLSNNSLRFIHPHKVHRKDTTVIIGGGLSGLSAGVSLVRAGRPVVVLEGEHVVGGLARTIVRDGFRFDLGGHRFITNKEKILFFIRDLLGQDLLTVQRKSKIYMHGKFFDYPLKPSNALFGLGLSTTVTAITDYTIEKMKHYFRNPVSVSLEDWVVNNFGRTMFNLYFKEYSEKIWGIECNSISKDWVSQRIRGLSLWVAMKNAFFKFNGRKIDTLVDKFVYPSQGIGRISDKLREGIERENTVLTSCRVKEIHHRDSFIERIVAEHCGKMYSLEGSDFVSSIPLTKLIHMLNPAVPKEIQEAASQLRYRDLVVVTIMLNRENVSELTWMYLPEKAIPIGRIHEPKNWSPYMAPKDKTSIVSEYFCFKGDEIWNTPDEDLKTATVQQLKQLGFIRENEVIDSCVIRVPKAYPLFEVGYTEYYDKILSYLENFKNLYIAGRSGTFRYYNMDHAIESGIEAAENILKKPLPEKEIESLPVGA